MESHQHELKHEKPAIAAVFLLRESVSEALNYLDVLRP